MDDPAPQKHSRICPLCGSERIHRSRRRGFKDWFRLFFLAKKPYRCNACDARFHLGGHSHHHPKKELNHRPA